MASSDNTSNTGYIVAGVVALAVLANVRGLFSGIGKGLGLDSETGKAEDETKAEAEVLARQFSDVSAWPELWTARPLYAAAGSGAVTVADIEANRRYLPQIADAVRAYYKAKGWILDDEAVAVSAVASMPTYVALLAMADTFFVTYGVTLGAYGATFLEAADKVAILRSIKQIRNL